MQKLYIIECQKFYKIGVTNDIKSRLAQLSTGNPFSLNVELYYEFENAEIVERALHQRYADSRRRGEWFEFEDYNTLKDIHTICLMLGGRAYEYTDGDATDSEVDEAEKMQSLPVGAKYDFAAMFADGWRMTTSDSRGLYWTWRLRKNGSDEVIYGGKVSDLPGSIEDVRRTYQESESETE